MKCLGKWFDDTLCDNTNTKRIEQQVSEGMMNKEMTGLPGKLSVDLPR